MFCIFALNTAIQQFKDRFICFIIINFILCMSKLQVHKQNNVLQKPESVGTGNTIQYLKYVFKHLKKVIRFLAAQPLKKSPK